MVALRRGEPGGREDVWRGTTEAYAYDRGLLSQSLGARGQIVKYGYDANSNLTLIDYPNMADVSLSYNSLDDVTQIVDGVGTHSFSYDNIGRLTALNGPFDGDEQSFTYDALQRLSSQSVNRGASGGTQSQSYAYDALGRLATLNSNGTQGVGAFNYNYVGLTGMLSRLDLPNGTQTTQSYDSLQRLTQVVNKKNSGTTLNAFAYAYDTRDVRTGVQQQYGSDPLRQVNYTYDSVDQLKSETASGGAANTSYSNAFDYDAMGNRLKSDTTQGTNSSSVRSSVNTLNQVTALSSALNGGPRVTSGFDYDAAGNTTKIENSDGSKTLFAYDDADRLTRIETRNAADAPLSKSEFVYDYASRKAVSREFVWTNGAWSQTDEKRRVFDGLDVIQERNSANEVTAQLVRDGNIGGILSRSTAAGATFFGYDGGGNVTLLTDENGDDVGRYRYDAFGNTLEAVGSRAAENPYRFSTKELHAASGLYDFGFRFYSASLGRWINRDPISESGGINLYAMVGNNPVNAVDNYGLKVVMVVDKKNMTIVMSLYIDYQGNGSKKSIRDAFNKAIETAWSGRIGKYKVRTIVIGPLPGVSADKYNVIQLEPVTPENRFYVYHERDCERYRTGLWLSSGRPVRAAHEAGHLMGLPDRYKDKKVNGKTVGSEAKDPNDKNWNKNIMGRVGQLPDGNDLEKIMNAPDNDVYYGTNAPYHFSGIK